MGDAVRIRPVDEADFDAWKPLWDGYNAFYGRSGETALPDEVTRITWARFFDAYEPVHALVAESSGELVGLVHYLFHRNTTRIRPTCYLEDLYSAEAARGLGVGRALVEAVYQAASAAGVSEVYWLTHGTNSTARRLYDQVATNSGFVVYSKTLTP